MKFYIKIALTVIMATTGAYLLADSIALPAPAEIEYISTATMIPATISRVSISATATNQVPSATASPTIATVEYPAVSFPDAYVRFYDIRGSTADELDRDMTAAARRMGRPSRWVAETMWSFEWSIDISTDDPVAPGCKVTAADVWYTAIVILPHWADQWRGSQILRDQWAAFFSGIVAHEEGHLEILRNNMPEAARRMMGATCARPDVTASEVRSWLSDLHAEYDIATQHGALTGAAFPEG